MALCLTYSEKDFRGYPFEGPWEKTKTATFQRDNCGSGFTGGFVEYSKHYISYISQAELDQQIMEDIPSFNSAGQANTNNNGTCTVIPPDEIVDGYMPRAPFIMTPDGGFYMVDFNRHVVIRYSGAFSAKFGRVVIGKLDTPGISNIRLTNPNGIRYYGEYIYVRDNDNKRITRFTPNNPVLETVATVSSNKTIQSFEISNGEVYAVIEGDSTDISDSYYWVVKFTSPSSYTKFADCVDGPSVWEVNEDYVGFASFYLREGYPSSLFNALQVNLLLSSSLKSINYPHRNVCRNISSSDGEIISNLSVEHSIPFHVPIFMGSIHLNTNLVFYSDRMGYPTNKTILENSKLKQSHLVSSTVIMLYGWEFVSGSTRIVLMIGSNNTLYQMNADTRVLSTVATGLVPPS